MNTEHTYDVCIYILKIDRLYLYIRAHIIRYKVNVKYLLAINNASICLQNMRWCDASVRFLKIHIFKVIIMAAIKTNVNMEIFSERMVCIYTRIEKDG